MYLFGVNEFSIGPVIVIKISQVYLWFGQLFYAFFMHIDHVVKKSGKTQILTSRGWLYKKLNYFLITVL